MPVNSPTDCQLQVCVQRLSLSHTMYSTIGCAKLPKVICPLVVIISVVASSGHGFRLDVPLVGVKFTANTQNMSPYTSLKAPPLRVNTPPIQMGAGATAELV